MARCGKQKRANPVWIRPFWKRVQSPDQAASFCRTDASCTHTTNTSIALLISASVGKLVARRILRSAGSFPYGKVAIFQALVQMLDHSIETGFQQFRVLAHVVKQ